MEPEGILKACTTNVRIKRASTTAMRIASPYSRKMFFFARTVLSDELFSFNVIDYLSSNRSKIPDAQYPMPVARCFSFWHRASSIGYLVSITCYAEGSNCCGSPRVNFPFCIHFFRVSAISLARTTLERGTVGTSWPLNRMVPLLSSL